LALIEAKNITQTDQRMRMIQSKTTLAMMAVTKKTSTDLRAGKIISNSRININSNK